MLVSATCTGIVLLSSGRRQISFHSCGIVYGRHQMSYSPCCFSNVLELILKIFFVFLLYLASSMVSSESKASCEIAIELLVTGLLFHF